MDVQNRTMLLLSMALGICAVLLFVESLFFTETHDWDIDAFLYIGSRLGHGELLYTHDFETKLPALQYLFFVAGTLGGIGAWRIITFIVSVASGSLASYCLAGALLRNHGPARTGPYRLTALCASLFLSLLYSLPGSGSAHIEMIAASGAYLSFALLLSGPQANTTRLVAISGVCLSLAALIRPNYLYIAPLSVGFLFFRECRANAGSSYTALMKPSVFCLGFIVPVALVLSPYFLDGERLSALIDGLSAIADYPNSFDLQGLIEKQLSGAASLFYFSLYAFCGPFVLYLMVYRLFETTYFINFIVFPVLAVVLLNVNFLRTHYWTHYAIMFVPYAVPLVVSAILASAPNSIRRPGKPACAALLVLCALIIVTPARKSIAMAHNTVTGRARFDGDINDRGIDSALLRFLERRKASGRTFLVVDDPIYHVLLDESRVGDGHPYILLRVLRGSRVGTISGIRLFGERVRAEPCRALLESDKDLIVVLKIPLFMRVVRNCLDEHDDVYEQQTLPELGDSLLYVRRGNGVGH